MILCVKSQVVGSCMQWTLLSLLFCNYNNKVEGNGKGVDVLSCIAGHCVM